MLKKNLNESGRWIRFLIACFLLIWGLKTDNLILRIASLFVFLEAIFSYCVVFAILGINQAQKNKS